MESETALADQVLRSSIIPVKPFSKSIKASAVPQSEQISVTESCRVVAGQPPMGPAHLGQFITLLPRNRGR